MKSLKTLEQLDNALSEELIKVKSFSFGEKKFNKQINNLTLSIEKELKLDYTISFNFREDEKERLEKIFINYLTGKGDDFNSHYIQLLAWKLIDLKVMNLKKTGRQSIFEYSPNRLAPYTVIEKTFLLFKKKRISPEKIYFALILNYLNNYVIASKRYKGELKKYLKDIKFSNDLDIYFDIENVINYVNSKAIKTSDIREPYPEQLKKLQINPLILNTSYFADAWYRWMFSYADLTDQKYVLRNLNCNFFNNCNEDMQKILFAKIICDNALSLVDNKNAEKICLEFIFPIIKKGNPFKEFYWNLNYPETYKIYLNRAWAFIEQNFVKNDLYKFVPNYEE